MGGLARRDAPAPAALERALVAVATSPSVSPVDAAPDRAASVPPASAANSPAVAPPIPTAEPALDAAEPMADPTPAAASPMPAIAESRRGSIPLIPTGGT